MSAARKLLYAADPELRARQVDIALAAARLSRRGRRHEYHDVRGRVFFFRSSWEREFAQALDAAALVWDYEPDRLVLPDGRIYVPDFRVLAWSGYVEIKGRPYPNGMSKVSLARQAGYAVTVIEGRAELTTAVNKLKGDPHA